MIETWFNQDTQQAVKVRYIDGNVFSMDNNGNKIGVNMFTNDLPSNVVGSISANVIRADGATVPVTGSSDGNKAWVVLPQEAYYVPGVISIIIKATASGNVTTLCAVVANVYQSSTSTVIDPGTIIPSIQDLIDAINAAIATIPPDYSNLLGVIAKTFDASKDYPNGQIVFYDGKLYVLPNGHEANATWENTNHIPYVMGDRVNDTYTDLKYGFSDANIIEIHDNWQWGKYYTCGEGVTSVDISSPSSSTNYACLYLECNPGDIFFYEGTGSSSARCMAFLSSASGANNKISNVGTSYVTGRFFGAPSGAAYAVVNVNKTHPFRFKKVLNQKTIVEGVDLNDCIADGVYCCDSWVTAATLSNLPPHITSGFMMTVQNQSILNGQTLTPNVSEKRFVQIVYSAVTEKEYTYIYIRFHTSAGFSDWQEIYDASSVYIDANHNTLIPDDSDLNDYLTPGSYYCPSATDSKTIDNVPLFVNSSFMMWVLNTSARATTTNFFRQLLFGNKYGSASIYTRQKNASTFGNWQLLIPSDMYESPMLVQASTFAPQPRVAGTVKKTIRIGTNNVAHYWLQGMGHYYLSNYPDTIANWRKWLLRANINILMLQECEDYIDQSRTENAFDVLYSPFFDEDTNVDEQGGTGITSKYRRKILNNLGLDTNSDMETVPTLNPELGHKDGYFNWCMQTISGVGSVLMINAHNFAYTGELYEADRKNYLDTLETFIAGKNPDYFIVAGDFNVITDTDRENLLTFCSDMDATPANGGIIGWFATHSSEEAGRTFDNIIVSNNIRIDSIECDPVLIPAKCIHSDHIPVTATISFLDVES